MIKYLLILYVQQLQLLYFYFSDNSTFKDILQFVNDNKLLKVKAIIWNVLPNIRKDAVLTKQAKLIDLFKPKSIWNNVIIICKQVSTFNGKFASAL